MIKDTIKTITSEDSDEVRTKMLKLRMVGACGFEPQTPTVSTQRSTLINLN